MATDQLELFVENYPTHPRVPEGTLRLAEHYRLTDRPAAAISALERLITMEVAGDSTGWADSARVALPVPVISRIVSMIFIPFSFPYVLLLLSSGVDR